VRAYLGLGSNEGDRAANLSAAVEGLDRRGIRIVSRSAVYETAPAGGPEQPDYLNQVVAAETAFAPRELLGVCHEIEADLGRDRTRETRWGPRPIDLDILAIEGVRVNEPDLVVPHPRVAERAFVLVPLAEIAPDLELPGLGRVSVLAASAPGLVRVVEAPPGIRRAPPRRRGQRSRP
jgi:2-amino-4-hydroxy-6-hydroxymethyldihydropteridine diphosphokinase